MAKKKTKQLATGYETWGDDVTPTKLRKNAKFNYKYVELAARLVASGHSEEDLGFVFGVAGSTIHSWKNRYPQFAKACANGKDLAKNYAVAQGLRSAAGYDYQEVVEEYERKRVESPEGEDTYEMILTKRKVNNKHVPANPTLNMFYVCNMDPTFQSLKSVQIGSEKAGVGGIKLDGSDMAAGIEKLCAGLFEAREQIAEGEAKKVDAIVVSVEPVTPEPKSTTDVDDGTLPDLYNA